MFLGQKNFQNNFAFDEIKIEYLYINPVNISLNLL